MKAAPHAAQSAATKEMMKDEFKKAVDSLNLSGDSEDQIARDFERCKTQRESIFKDSGLTDEQKQGKLAAAKAKTIQ